MGNGKEQQGADWLKRTRKIVKVFEQAARRDPALTFVEIIESHPPFRIKMSRQPGATESASASNLSSEAKSPELFDPTMHDEIIAPWAGIFYTRPNQDQPPYVQEGSRVNPGDTVCLIEAMKTFSEIKAENGGKVVHVLVKEKAVVHPGTRLMIIDKTA